MSNRQLRTITLIGLGFVSLALVVLLPWFMSTQPQLLTDPFLQYPTEDSVRVVWFTEFPGTRHTVEFGESLEQTAVAVTTQLSRTREDQQSRLANSSEDNPAYPAPTPRPIWRHEAVVRDLRPGQQLPYRVNSAQANGSVVQSGLFTLAPQPAPNTPLKILLTSDHQLKPMTAANLQKVVETVGGVDAVFLAGDLVNVPDRASEWFDDSRGGAFFPCLQGRAQYELNGTVYRGGALIQSAPLFTAIGNHEVMGRFSTMVGLSQQFDDAIPRAIATQRYTEKAQILNPENDPSLRATWIEDNSFNVRTYEEIFTLPRSVPGGEQYYAVTFGDIRLVVLYVTHIWRVPNPDNQKRGRYGEGQQNLDNPERWGYGQHIFEAIAPGSPQYTWLTEELNSREFQQAKYKIVMLHHPPHSLGDNVVPPYTDPIPRITRSEEGRIQAIRYEYPRDADYIARDVVPRLESAGVHLVLYGHSHLWNRFVSPSGTHYLETSNVGNTYGAYIGDRQRPVPKDDPENNYVATGDPNGLEAIVPTIAPLTDEKGQTLPYVASNDITVFSILDTATGTVSSYRYDTRSPNADVVKFDAFTLAATQSWKR